MFQLKLKALLAELLQKNVLGVVAAYTWTIEFQKRGLPHAHILLVMRSGHKPRTAADVDRVVTAELPDKDDPLQKDLYETVVTSMLHGPCGEVGKPCCNEQGVCGKGFPHDFVEATEMIPEQYPTYRRRENGRGHMKSGVRLDNRWVVPYNPYLVSVFKAPH